MICLTSVSNIRGAKEENVDSDLQSAAARDEEKMERRVEQMNSCLCSCPEKESKRATGHPTQVSNCNQGTVLTAISVFGVNIDVHPNLTFSVLKVIYSLSSVKLSPRGEEY